MTSVGRFSPPTDMKPNCARLMAPMPVIGWLMSTWNLKFLIGSVAMCESDVAMVTGMSCLLVSRRLGDTDRAVVLADPDGDELGGLLESHADIDVQLAISEGRGGVVRVVTDDVER